MTVLLRHDEIAWNANGRVQGWASIPLAEHGRDQATAATSPKPTTSTD